VESLDLGNGDKDDNSLLSTLGVNLLCGRDLELPQLGLELGDILLEVDESLSDGLLDFRGSGSRGVGGPLNLVLERHVGLKVENVSPGSELCSIPPTIQTSHTR